MHLPVQKRISYSILSVIFFLSCCLSLSAQSHVDVLRYSRKDYPGNARSLATGNALGAVGSNPISASINPAGFGLYRNNEVSLSLSTESIKHRSLFLDNRTSNTKFNFNISNLSLVLNKINYELGEVVKKGFVSYSFAIGMNRSRTLHKNIISEGVNSRSSMLEDFVEQADGTNPENLDKNTTAGLAYFAFLINPYYEIRGEDTVQYYSAILDTTPLNIRQKNTINSQGGTNDLFLSFGANYSNWLYFGATVAFPTVTYREENTFHEKNLKNNITNYQSMKFKETFKTDGTGFMGGVGVILRPVKYFRFGASIYSPTYYGLEDHYGYEIQSRLKIDSNYKYESSVLSFKYKMTTPFRANFSAATIFGKWGFLSFDYEIVDYSLGNLSSKSYGFETSNQTVQNIYKTAGNIRIGGEFRYRFFYLRGGYAFYESPFKSGTVPSKVQNGQNIYSGGVGFRGKKINLDLAYQVSKSHNVTVPYELDDNFTPFALNERIHKNLVFTFSYLF